jgi:hypothetical protein
MRLPQVLFTAVGRVEVGVAKAGVAVVKAEVNAARAEEVQPKNFLMPVPPCCRCRQPQGLVLPMLSPQVLYTVVERVEVGVAKAGVAVVKGEVEAARAKVMETLNFSLPAPPCYQRPQPNQESCCGCRRS